MLNNVELALAKLALHSPEFISLTSRLEFIPDPACPTAGTDGRRLFYNPEWIASMSLRQAIGLILHEVGHNMLAHPARVGSRDKQLANVAMDIVLNENLQEYFNETRSTLNAEFPEGDLTPNNGKWAKYKGWNWEKVYADLMENGDKTKQFDYVEAAQGEDGRQLSEAEAEMLAREWAMAAQQAATMAKQRGLQSGFFESFVTGLVATKVNWRAQLWDVFIRTAKDDQSYRKFNRKFIHAQTYLPAMHSERIGSVVFATDTSGSMEDDNFKIGLGGMNEILESVKPEKITHICCDTKVQSVEELTADDLPIQNLHFKGRGGTILTPIFEHIKEMEEPPELVVVLTDGECDTIAKDLEPGCPVVWLVTTDSMSAIEGSFGKAIRVEA